MQTLGKVYLVGAGPGDPGLLTVEALRLLQLSDRTDPITQIVAERIIQAAQTAGVHEPSDICRLAIKDLRFP